MLSIHQVSGVCFSHMQNPKQQFDYSYSCFRIPLKIKVATDDVAVSNIVVLRLAFLSQEWHFIVESSYLTGEPLFSHHTANFGGEHDRKLGSLSLSR